MLSPRGPVQAAALPVPSKTPPDMLIAASRGPRSLDLVRALSFNDGDQPWGFSGVRTLSDSKPRSEPARSSRIMNWDSITSAPTVPPETLFDRRLLPDGSYCPRPSSPQAGARRWKLPPAVGYGFSRDRQAPPGMDGDVPASLRSPHVKKGAVRPSIGGMMSALSAMSRRHSFGSSPVKGMVPLGSYDQGALSTQSAALLQKPDKPDKPEKHEHSDKMVPDAPTPPTRKPDKAVGESPARRIEKPPTESPARKSEKRVDKGQGESSVRKSEKTPVEPGSTRKVDKQGASPKKLERRLLDFDSPSIQASSPKRARPDPPELPAACADLRVIKWCSPGAVENKTRLQLSRRATSTVEAEWRERVNKISGRRGWEQGDGLYIINGSAEFRRCLEEYGFLACPDGDSDIFDFKWVINHNDLDHRNLHPCQVVNHYQRSAIELGAKVGLLRNVRSLSWFDGINVNSFMPRTYNLHTTWELLAFIDDFLAGEARRLLLLHEQRQVVDPARLQHAVTMTESVLDNLANPREGPSHLPTFSIDDLYILRPELHSKHGHAGDPPAPPALSAEEAEKLADKAAAVLAALRVDNHQLNFDGAHNVWICKPGHSSRGRGIRVFDDLKDILQWAAHRKHACIAQKYLERPNLVDGKKFDIRCWVLVTDWNPLTFWAFDPCYIRLTTVDHDLSDLTDLYAHLCNRCVQKNSGQYQGEDKGGEGHMWDSNTFKNYLDREYGAEENVWDSKIWPRMREVILYSLHSVQDTMEPFSRRNTFEWFGFDLMLDPDWNCFLLEVNISPDMAVCTDVLARVVPAAVQDLVSIFYDGDPPDNKAARPRWHLVYKGKTQDAKLLRQRRSYKQWKNNNMSAGQPFSMREALMDKLGPRNYLTIMGKADLQADRRRYLKGNVVGGRSFLLEKAAKVAATKQQQHTSPSKQLLSPTSPSSSSDDDDDVDDDEDDIVDDNDPADVSPEPESPSVLSPGSKVTVRVHKPKTRERDVTELPYI